MEPNINPSGMMNGIPPVARSDRRLAPIIGALVIVLVVIIGALYFLNRNDVEDNIIDDTTTAEENSVPSRDTASIQAEANASDAAIESDLDAQLDGVDYSF